VGLKLSPDGWIFRRHMYQGPAFRIEESDIQVPERGPFAAAALTTGGVKLRQANPPSAWATCRNLRPMGDLPPLSAAGRESAPLLSTALSVR